MQIPAPFDYHRAGTVAEALELRNRLGSNARFVAGGHSLLPMMKLRLATPDHLIDINDLTELAEIRETADVVEIGAMVRHSELLTSPLLAEHFPIFGEAEQVIADPLVRARGTIGGSLCQADPSEDLTAVCQALNATAVIRSASAQRLVSMADFYRGPYETAVDPDEILTAIRFPKAGRTGSAFEKVERRAGDWAIVSVAAAVSLDGPLIREGRVGLAAVGPDTAPAEATSQLLRGTSPSEKLFADVGAAAANHCTPRSDQRGTAAYKTHLVNELTIRCLRRAVERAAAKAA